MANPLLLGPTKQKHFDSAIDFHALSWEHFWPAAEKTFHEALENIEAIEKNPQPPSFINTVLALEAATENFSWVETVYSNLFSAEASTQLQSLAEKIFPLTADLYSRMTLSEKLFERIQAVWHQRHKIPLDTEDNKLLEITYRQFIRGGALLNTEQKEELKTINRRLAELGPAFSNHVLQATNSFALTVTNPKDLEGLPESLIEAAKEEAEKRGQKDCWIFTLHQPIFIPFLQFAKSRHLRQTLWMAYQQRGLQQPWDNVPLIFETLKLRQRRAELLGYKNHAEYVLEERMAKTPEKVFDFLRKLLEAYKPAALKDLQEVRELAQQTDGIQDFSPWDFSYYAERLKKNKYDFNDEDLRPYLPLDKVINGVFEHSEKLFQIQFFQRTDIPVYHPDVKVYEVQDKQSGEFIGLLYADFFPRETKRPGAWMSVLRQQGLWQKEIRRPHVTICCNFTKPTHSKPALLTIDEVSTFFHEFGHALHGLLSKCKYRSLSGTNVRWDFVELPSQIMENWVYEKEGLSLFAHHYETGHPIPDELVTKLRRAKNFLAGWYGLRQLNFAFLDMYFHCIPPSPQENLLTWEEKVTQETRLFPVYPQTSTSTAFSHIFAGEGYSAGYYSYKWAEVLDADAFEYFKEKGIYHPEPARKFKEFILEKGGSEEPEVLYEKFRGRPAQVEALLRREGLLTK